MNYMAAAQDTMDVAERMWPINNKDIEPSCRLDHLRMMLREMRRPMRPGKANRWLGWMQACVVSWDVGVSLETMKQINQRHRHSETDVAVVIKLLRAIAEGSDAQSHGHHIILLKAAEMLEE